MSRIINNLFLINFLIYFIAMPLSAAQESFKPVTPLDTTWRIPSSMGDLKDNKELIQSNATTVKAQAAFKDAMSKLSKNLKPAEQNREIAALRQSSLKLGPKAKTIAELTAARVIGGLSASGNKAGKPTGNWRQHLLSACNAAAKIDDATHEQIATQAVIIWRRIEGNEASWAIPPIDLKAQRQFEFAKAIIERQALYDWFHGNESSSLKKYRALSVSFNATPIGAAIDLRLIELERAIYRKDKQLRRWQKAIIDTENKYQDKEFLGAGNEAKVERLTSTIARIHKDLIDSLIKEAVPVKASDGDRKQAIAAIEAYLGTSISDAEKIRVRAASGEIQHNGGNHKAAAGTFAALATESTGPKAVDFWRKAIRSQTILAQWPVDAPWNGIPKGDMEPREVLIDMYKHTDGGTAKDWNTAAQVGLLMIANARAEDAFTFWSDRIQKFPTGLHASRSAGWIVTSRVNAKQWNEVENLGRILVKANLPAIHANKTYRPKDILGIGLLEGGLEALTANDYKKSISKLDEYVKGWRTDARHDQGLYHLALAYHGDKQYRTAVTTLTSYVKSYSKSKWRRDALINGGAWTLALTWEDFVMFFLETHALEYPKDLQSISSLQILSDLYMGREIYDSAIRVMTILVNRNDLEASMRVDVARRLLDTVERRGTPENAVRIADKIQASFKNESLISSMALSVKARIFADRKNISGIVGVEKQMSALDQSQPAIAEMISEVRFLLADGSAKDKFKDQIFSLGTRDPKAQLEKGYAQFTELDRLYKSACLSVRTGWCGPALHRAARLGEEFLRSYDDLVIAKTLDPDEVKEFTSRKKAIVETVENLTIESDEKSLEQVRSGATNPDWTSAILWQNGAEWSKAKFTSDSAAHFIQWHAR